MKTIETSEYLLPEFWASPLINADFSGMSDEDDNALNGWLAANDPGYCVGCSEESEFTAWHDARAYVLACECLTFAFHKEVTK